jgi:DNA-binding response OmpR family regulator
MIRQVRGSGDGQPSNNGIQPSAVAAFGTRLVLDESERCIQGLGMAPLLAGEFKLLSYLGKRWATWHSSYELSVRVYHREDAAGRQLVWKYASTLRRKLVKVDLDLIALCRRRGYRCRHELLTVGGEHVVNALIG